MKVLVVGSGGREHAICHSFRRSSRVSALYCANGNAGIAEIAECVPVKPTDVAGLVEFASQNAIDLTFVGGETSLALGIVDEFEARSLKIVGPGKHASRMESSKSFAKDFMARHGVPTAKYVTAHSPSAAVLALEGDEFGDEMSPVVVKADGLAAGKGVVVAASRADAVAPINEMADLVGADAAEKIVLEECLFGKEVSLLMFASGEDFALMPPTRDHKRIGQGDTGPNTGGMGTITDASLLTSEELDGIVETIVRPTLRGCVAEGFPFRGILFLGIMMTGDPSVSSPHVSKGSVRSPKLLEYNVRFGDPETQAILVRLETDLVDICEAMVGGTSREFPDIVWKPGSSACIVLASQGYPSQPKTGDVISGLDSAAHVPNVSVFHAGTSMLVPGEYYTAGGRVLGVTATGGDLDEALSVAYEAASKISFDGMQFRRDIGKPLLSEPPA